MSISRGKLLSVLVLNHQDDHLESLIKETHGADVEEDSFPDSLASRMTKICSYSGHQDDYLDGFYYMVDPWPEVDED